MHTLFTGYVALASFPLKQGTLGKCTFSNLEGMPVTFGVEIVRKSYRIMLGSLSRRPWGDETYTGSGTCKLGTSVLMGLWSGPGPEHGQTHEQRR